jgi:hypothetical protein
MSPIIASAIASVITALGAAIVRHIEKGNMKRKRNRPFDGK